jgi:hypothetical protein
VQDDIVGVKNYSLRTLDISNGMKISFSDDLVNEEYQNKQYYVANKYCEGKMKRTLERESKDLKSLRRKR